MVTVAIPPANRLVASGLAFYILSTVIPLIAVSPFFAAARGPPHAPIGAGEFYSHIACLVVMSTLFTVMWGAEVVCGLTQSADVRRTATTSHRSVLAAVQTLVALWLGLVPIDTSVVAFIGCRYVLFDIAQSSLANRAHTFDIVRVVTADVLCVLIYNRYTLSHIVTSFSTACIFIHNVALALLDKSEAAARA